jgi:hypothetical protein
LEVPKLKALCVFICEACAGHETPMNLAVMVEKKIKMPPIKEFSLTPVQEGKF